MKQAFGIFAALILMPSFQVQAWTGGPWSNNSYQANGDDGIYEAIGTLTDGTAMYRWAVNNENAGGQQMVGGQANGALTSNVQFGGLVGAASPHVIWYRGIIYYGRCFGIVNSDMRGVWVTGNAANRGLNGADSQINGVDLNIGAGGLEDANFANNSTVVSARKSVANSTFKAKLDKNHPQKRFHGYGTISFVGNPDFDLIVVEDFDIVITDDDNPINVLTVESQSSGPSFLPEGHRVGMKVFGNQVSVQVNG